MKRSFLLFAPLLAACAASQVRPSEPLWSGEPPAEPPAPKVDPVTFARRFPRALECEQAAREIHARSADQGWLALQACVGRGDFQLLLPLLRDWSAELRSRPEGPSLVARVIAMRGGDVPDDLRLLHDYEVPVFSLADAVAAPQVYQGHYVLLRARVAEVRAGAGEATAKLEETTLSSREGWHPEGLAQWATQETTGQASYAGTAAAYYGPPPRAHSTSRSTSARMSRRFENVSVDTGLYALAKMKQANPFLEPEEEMIVLARFDGLREVDSDDGDTLPMLTLVGYAAPSALQVR